jgi:hypothetical protein
MAGMTMPKDITRTIRKISTALDAAYQRALEQEKAEGERVLELRNARLVILSDQHKGNRDGADDFRVCESAYNAALAYYYRLHSTPWRCWAMWKNSGRSGRKLP